MKSIFDSLSEEKFSIPVFFNRKTGSTNLDAKNMVKSGQKTPFAVLAETQSASYGQQGARWEGESPGNFYLSVAFDIPLEISDKIFLLPQCIAAEICKFIEKTLGISVQTKWPNDIFIDRKKVGGLLLEVARGKKNISSAVLGVGINILQAPKILNSEYEATSLRSSVGSDFDSLAITKGIINLVISKVQNINLLMQEEVSELWKRFDYMFGRNVDVVSIKTVVSGKHSGIGKNGCLLILDNFGNLIAIEQGDAKIRMHKDS